MDSLGGLLWVAGHRSLIQLELNQLDQAPRAISIPGTAPGAKEDDDKKILALAVDPLLGNLWVVTKDNLLLIYDRGGNLLKNVDIGAYGLGEVEQIAFEPVSASFWLGGERAVGRFSGNGDLVARVAVDHNIDALGVVPFRLMPTLSLLAPADGDLTNNSRPPIRLGLGASCNAAPCFLPDVYLNSLVLNVSLDGQAIGSLFSRATSNEALYIAPSRLPEGLNVLNSQAVDLFGHASDPLTAQFTIDTIPPKFLSITPSDGSTVAQANVVIRGQVDDATAVVMIEGLTGLDGQILNTDPRDFAFQVTLQPGVNNLTLTATDPAHNVGTATIKLMLGDTLPPDPSTVASPIDSTVTTTVADVTAFLYQGNNPIQRDVAPGVIEPKRAAVLRGVVRARDNAPLSQVTIKIKGHAEYGHTLSRADGMFDMAVNGGGVLTVEYFKEGFLPVQRQINVPWGNHVWLPDVVMTPLDDKVTTIDLNAGSPMQVAQGSKVTDQDGSRQATIFFPQGITAAMVMPDGTTQALTTLHVRATEYTVGPNGPKAMPAALPPTSGYTYAVELSADEAIAAGAKEVRFSNPIPAYVDNFLNFPVGGIVPAGYYDRDKAAWIPSANGRVIKVLGSNGGLVDLDVDGSGSPAGTSALAALGISDAERGQLAALYQTGQTLWRVPTVHFTPWDYNWPYGPPSDATAPQQPDPQKDEQEKDPCHQSGSIIECQNQILGEEINVVGTPFSLRYQSDRVPGRKAANTYTVRLSGATLPPSLKRIDLNIEVAGRQFTQSFSTLPNQSYVFTWDGLDAYGRSVNGSQMITIRIGYVYQGLYQQPAQFQQSFGVASGAPISGSHARQEITIWQEYHDFVGPWDARGQGLGGWALSVHHVYDPVGKILYYGDGTRRAADTLNAEITTVASLPYPWDAAVDDKGNTFVTSDNDVVYKIDTNGNTTVIAGGGRSGLGDGGPALSASFDRPLGIVVDPAGNLFVADLFHHRIRKITPDGTITTVAGNGTAGFSGDGGPATSAALGYPTFLALDEQGNLFVTSLNRVRKISPSGIITTVAGNGNSGYSGDGGPATAATLYLPGGITLDAQGNLYIADIFNARIRKVGTGGIITTVAGNGSWAYAGDGGPAKSASLRYPYDVAIDEQGNLLIADYGNSRVRRVAPTGLITTLAGNGVYGFGGDNGPATAASLANPTGLAFDKQGNVLVMDQFNDRVRKVSPALPGGGFAEIDIPSDDGRYLFHFDSMGRHLRTSNVTTGAIVYSFTYDSSGYLDHITDGDGNVTRIEHDTAGQPLAIVAPDGQRTSLTLDANGYLASITNPANEKVRMAYTEDGLLTTYTNARDLASRMTYDTLGRLVKDENPAGGSWSLSRSDSTNGYEARMSSALNRTTTYHVEELATGDRLWRNTGPDGMQVQTLFKTDGTTVTTRADGTTTTQVETGDPRFGMQVPITKSLTTRLPSGLTSVASSTRNVSLADPGNPLSLSSMTDTLTVNGKTSITVYNAATMQYMTTTPAGRQSFTTIDGQGRPTQTQVSGLDPVSYGYDLRGRLTTITQGGGTDMRKSALAYNPQGFLDSITDALGRNQSYNYDSAGRVTQQTLPDGRLIQYTYDANGNVTSITPPGRPSHGFSYTPVDLEAQYTPPAAGIASPATQYAYNLDKQLTQIMRPDGQTVDFGYDAGGRLSTVTLPNGTITYTYNATTGNLQTLTAPDNGTVRYAYDGSLVNGVTWTGSVNGTVAWVYNNDFRVTNLAVNGNGISFSYDADSMLTQAGSLTISRDPNDGLITGTTLGSTATSQSYNPFGEMTHFTASQGSSAVLDVQYTRDKLGRITQKIETVSGQTDTYVYNYDQAGRLTDVNKNGSLDAHYDYDPNSNRIGTSGAVGNVTGSYDQQDRLLTYGNNSYSYTDNGELKSKIFNGQTTNYVYDVLGNLRSVSLPNGTTIDYVIDGQNRRIGKKVNGTLTQAWLYQDQLKPVAELDGSGNVVARFVYGSRPNVPDYMIKGANTYRIISDHLGSPRLIIDTATATGNIVQRLDYDEFGNVLQDTNPGFQPFGFAGGLYDNDTKLVRFGARDYDAQTGRWTSKDPIRFGAGDVNLYGYTFDDPVNFIDPDGHFVGVVVAAVAVVATGWALWELWQNIATSAQDASKTYDLQQQEQQMIDDMLNGKSVDPNKFQDLRSQATNARQQTLRDLEKTIKDRPPGTSARPLINKVPAVKKLICP